MSGADGPGSDLAIQLANLLQNNVNQQPQNPKLSDNLQINLKLNSQNYALWTRMIRVAIGGRSKTLLSHLTKNPPEQTNENYETWEQEDLIVFLWLIQNIEPMLASNLTEYSTAKELWDALGVWREIDRTDPNPMKCPEDIKTYAKIRSDQKLFRFLNGFDRKFKPIKREFLQGIATGLIAGETEGVGFVTKGYRQNDGNKKWVTSDDKSHLKCEECGMSRHTKEQCFRIVGYRNWWTDGNKKGTKSAKTKKEKDIRTGHIIGRGIETEGLYYVDEVTTSGTVMLAHGTSEREAWLWHRRLGHPSNTTSAGAQEQSSLNISATEDTVPNLISEVSNSQPSDSLNDIPKNIHETVGVQEHEKPTLTEVEEPTLTEILEKYVLLASKSRLASTSVRCEECVPTRRIKRRSIYGGTVWILSAFQTWRSLHRGDRVTCLLIYVDDMIITGNDESEIKKLKEGLCAEFEMKDFGNIRNKDDDCKPADTHMITNQKLFMKTKAKLANRNRYQRMAGDKGNRRSTSGYFFLVGGNLLTWKSKKQKVVSLSSAEAELRDIAKGIAETLWIRKLVSEIGFPPKESIRIMSDNKAAIQIS
nr:hypothetical protein [Tanacetum cinerariifolium]